MNTFKKIQNYKIISTLVIFLVLSISYLSWTEFKQRELTKTQDWWAVYFEDAKSSSLDFIIENKAGNDTFTWKIYSDNEDLLNGTETIETNQITKVEVSNKIEFESPNHVIVEVKKGKEKKTIYKNL